MEKAALYNVQSSIILIIRILLCEKATGVREGKPGLQGVSMYKIFFYVMMRFVPKKS